MYEIQVNIDGKWVRIHPRLATLEEAEKVLKVYQKAFPNKQFRIVRK